MNDVPAPSAPAASPAEAARRLIELLNARDLDGVAALQHEDVVDDFVAVGVYRGRAEVRRFFEELFGAFPDFRLEVVRVTAADDMAVVEWTAEGTFTGSPFQGVHANGKRVAQRGVDCMRFEGGRLRHNVIYYDGAAFARGVGLLPAQGSAGETGLKAAFNALTGARKALGI
ncbi:MAG: ester cyclase [Myxococcales bacterium]|nr:ester cyclase [Myxococcales bacterium]